MAHITKIKAGEPSAKKEPLDPPKGGKPRDEAKNSLKAQNAEPEAPKSSSKAAEGKASGDKAPKSEASANKTSEGKASEGRTPETSKKSSNKSKGANQTPSDTSGKKPFILFRPFVAFGRYLRDSWREIRQVRWPSRKATWQMFLAVIVYALIFGVLIILLDLFFEWIFNLILSK